MIYNVIILLIEFFGIGTVVAIFREFKKYLEGQRCLLRSEILRTYYHCKEDRKIRQFELENFIKNYQAYKALGGNSFIDKIYEEVIKWEVTT